MVPQQRKRPDKRQKKLQRTFVNVSLAPHEPARRISAMQALDVATQKRDELDLDGAKFICQQLLGHPFASTDASIIMLEIALQLRRPAEIHEFCERLINKSVPPQPHSALAIASALRELNRHEEAFKYINKALKTHPSSCDLRSLLAGYLIEVNEKDRAISELRQIQRIDRDFMPTYQRLSLLDSLTEDEVSWLERTEFPDQDRVSVHRTLARVYRSRKNYDKEFEHLDLAHQAVINRRSIEPGIFHDSVENTMKVFSAEFLRDQQCSNALESRHIPIFIVGTPRSGSTLTEQILQSSENVEGIGETGIVHVIVQELCKRRFGNTPYVDAIGQLNQDDFAEIGEQYLNQVQSMYTDATISVNKQLGNYLHIGILSLALPNAKFVHTLRHPLDNCLSIYQQVFEAMEEHSLEALAETYRDHLRIMGHWQNLIGDRIFTARYEDMVANPREQSRALLDFCGIPWTEDVLDFHKSEKAVKTASLTQVRKPIYSSSVEKWRPYQKHLVPLIEALGLNVDGSDINGYRLKHA